jgi:hypothetical protein
MHITFRYPLLFRGFVTGLTAERFVFASETAAFDIPVLDEHRAPVSMTWHAEGAKQPVIYRQIGERLYDAIGPAKEWAGFRQLSWNCAMSSMLEEARSAFDRIDDKGAPYAYPSMGRLAVEKLLDIEAVPLRKGSKMDGIERWRDMANAVASTMFIVDGQLWRECREPVFQLYRNNKQWTMALRQGIDPTGDPMRFHFDVGSYDEAVAFMGQLASATGKPSTDDSFHTTHSFSPSEDTELADLVRCVDCVLSSIDGYIGSRAAETKKWSLADVSPHILTRYASLRMFLEDETKGAASRASAVSDIEAIMPLCSEAGMRPVIAKALAVSAHIEKWNLGTIGFGSRFEEVGTQGGLQP